jgi:hypothetical protein
MLLEGTDSRNRSDVRNEGDHPVSKVLIVFEEVPHRYSGSAQDYPDFYRSLFNTDSLDV